MEELDAVAEEFLAVPLTRVRCSPDGKLIFHGHGRDATLLDVVSHGFFHPPSEHEHPPTAHSAYRQHLFCAVVALTRGPISNGRSHYN